MLDKKYETQLFGRFVGNDLHYDCWCKMIGQEVFCKKEVHKIIGVSILHDGGALIKTESFYIKSIYCRPVLRKFNDMTASEAKELQALEDGPRHEVVDFLDHIGVDQRGLIDDGIALDSSNIHV